MRVAITFDVESDFSLERSFNNIRDSLPSILKVLNEENIKSTFFVTGKVLEKLGGEVLDMLKGHEIASHGYNHCRLDKLDKTTMEDEVRKSRTIFSYHGLEPLGFRAPKLCINEKILDIVSKYYRYDSSIAPFAVPFRYFNPLKQRVPHTIKGDFLEIPIGTINFLRFPSTSSWMFLTGKRYLDLLGLLGYPEVFVVLFHSFDFIKYEKPKGLPMYKDKFYYSKCGTDKINFLRNLIGFFKDKKEKFSTCDEIYKLAASSHL